MKKTNITSMLAVAGGLALTTAACSAPAEDAASETDAMAVEGAEPCEGAYCGAMCDGAECGAMCDGAECGAMCDGAECGAA